MKRLKLKLLKLLINETAATAATTEAAAPYFLEIDGIVEIASPLFPGPYLFFFSNKRV